MMSKRRLNDATPSEWDDLNTMGQSQENYDIYSDWKAYESDCNDSQYKSDNYTAKQVDGNHYIKCSIQPIDYIIGNKLGFCEGNVVKYVTRYKDKGGLSDLNKAMHYLEMLIIEEESKL